MSPYRRLADPTPAVGADNVPTGVDAFDAAADFHDRDEDRPAPKRSEVSA